MASAFSCFALMSATYLSAAACCFTGSSVSKEIYSTTSAGSASVQALSLPFIGMRFATSSRFCFGVSSICGCTVSTGAVCTSAGFSLSAFTSSLATPAFALASARVCASHSTGSPSTFTTPSSTCTWYCSPSNSKVKSFGFCCATGATWSTPCDAGSASAASKSAFHFSSISARLAALRFSALSAFTSPGIFSQATERTVLSGLRTYNTSELFSMSTVPFSLRTTLPPVINTSSPSISVEYTMPLFDILSMELSASVYARSLSNWNLSRLPSKSAFALR